MIKNYFKIAIRNLVRQKVYSVINVLGLAIGLACSFLIILYIKYELSYDRFHSKADQIYRVATKGEIAGDFLDVAVSSTAFLPGMLKEFPEVENGSRINDANEIFFTYDEGNVKSYESKFLYVDSTFFTVFDFELVLGDPYKVLCEPNTVVLTKTTAEKYFGKENPIGKVLRLNDKVDYTVTGVAADPPANSHIQFDGLISYLTLYEMIGQNVLESNWGSLSQYTYVVMNKETNIDQFQEKLSPFVYNHMKEQIGDYIDSANIKIIPYLQPLTSIHLHSNLMAELSNNNSINNIYIFGAIAIFILIIACINFMNLSTARSSRRSKEVGLRKVHGALRKQLIFQFIGESVLISLMAFVLAVVFVELSIPIFNSLLDVQLNMNLLAKYQLLSVFIGIALFTGVLAGSYPAFYLSAFNPTMVLKGLVNKLPKRLSLRNVLVVLQFAISIFLIISTIIIFSQIKYIQSKELGFDRENVLIIPLRGENLQNEFEYIKTELSKLSIVKSTSGASSIPGFNLNGSGFIPEGKSETDMWLIYNMLVDYDYVNTLGIKLISGRNFSREFGTDTSAILVNETLVKKLGWEDPLGKIIHQPDDEKTPFKIIGVVKDFHFKSLQSIIEPLILFLTPRSQRFIYVKFNKGNIADQVTQLQEKWDEIETEFPFDYIFLDKRLETLYQNEQKTGKIFIAFTILAIFIACLGLFGLAAYIAEQRTKEIGIRKALGAKVNQIIILLSKEFTKWVLISNIIAWPLAWYFMNSWLKSFAYTIKVELWIFLVAGIIALLIAFITVGYQSIKASSSNPVDALKYE